MSTFRSSSAVALALVVCLPLWAQSLDHAIPLDDADPASLDNGFGIALSADGLHAYAPIAGAIFPQTANNDDVALLDVLAGVQLSVAPTGLFPEDVALTHDLNGAVRHVYVSNSSSGSVTCFSPTLAAVATVVLPLCLPFGSYPFGVLVSPAQDRLYVTTLGGCGDVFVVDTDPASASFNTVVTSFVVPGGGGRPSWGPHPVMVIPTTTYDAPSSSTLGGFAVVDVTNPLSPTNHLVSTPMLGQFASTTECVVIPGGKVLLSIGYESSPTLYECAIATGAITRTLDLTGFTSTILHGLATNPGQKIGIITSLNRGDSVFFDIDTFTVIGAYDHGATTLPNDAVFTQDGSRVVVSLQGVARVDVVKDIPGYTLNLSAPASVSLGGTLTYTIDNCESGQGCAMYFSLAGAGPQQAGAFTVHLSNPFYLAFEAIGDLHGDASASFVVPNIPGLSGMTISTQAGTVDRDGDLRLSGGEQTLIN